MLISWVAMKIKVTDDFSKGSESNVRLCLLQKIVVFGNLIYHEF